MEAYSVARNLLIRLIIIFNASFMHLCERRGVTGIRFYVSSGNFVIAFVDGLYFALDVLFCFIENREQRLE